MTITKIKGESWPHSWLDGKPNNESYGVDTTLVKTLDIDMFHIGQAYETEAAKTLECTKCGGREFNVGRGEYFTAIRCPRCGWEYCEHEG